MPRSRASKVALAVKVPRPLKEALERYAEKRNIALADAVREILNDALIEERDPQLIQFLDEMAERMDYNTELILTLNLQSIRILLMLVQHHLEDHAPTGEAREKWEDLKRQVLELEDEAAQVLRRFRASREALKELEKREATRDEQEGG